MDFARKRKEISYRATLRLLEYAVHTPMSEWVITHMPLAFLLEQGCQGASHNVHHRVRVKTSFRQVGTEERNSVKSPHLGKHYDSLGDGIHNVDLETSMFAMEYSVIH